MFATIKSWWSKVPQKRRVQVIAFVLLMFAGSEVLVLAPFMLDLAVTIDLFGMAMVIVLLRSALSASAVEGLWAVLKPVAAAIDAIDRSADFGVAILSRWEREYLVVDVVCTRVCMAFLALSLGLALTAVVA